jgi:hypothetical protein
LQQIHNGTTQTITLDIYSQGQLMNADGSVIVKITDADTGTVLVSSASAVGQTPLGKYTYEVTPDITQSNRVLQVLWSYTLGGKATSQTQFVEVVTPYALVSDIISYYKLGAAPSQPNYYSEQEIMIAENIARTQINNYTMQDFGNRYDYQEIFGIGSDAIQLTERMLAVDKLYENDELVIDYTASPTYNSFGFDVELTQTGKALRIKTNLFDTRYDNQVDPTIIAYGKFRNNSRYKIVGKIGYNYVPQDIKLCTLLLCGDLLSNDAAWRNKYLKKVTLAEVSFELSAGALNGTGNVIVDGILDQYRNINIVVI